MREKLYRPVFSDAHDLTIICRVLSSVPPLGDVNLDSSLLGLLFLVGDCLEVMVLYMEPLRRISQKTD